MNELGPAQIVWPLMTVLVAVAAVASAVVSIANARKRVPPLPEELAKTYATKDEVSDAYNRLSDRIDREIRLICDNNAEHVRKLDALFSTTNHANAETQRSLGRIEGKLDSHLEAHS